jgi:hypothetical protein
MAERRALFDIFVMAESAGGEAIQCPSIRASDCLRCLAIANAGREGPALAIR